ncbi:MAG: phosphoesterase RecJ domain protein [Gemmatimonadetes bacterium]|nr:phosphoesterase RecJ domain protein [Gemmatimonadota bacterium]
MTTNIFDVSPSRREQLERFIHALGGLKTIALSTHINADGDGCGSETAFARLLAQMGIAARIVNPTPWPALFDFLLGADITERSSKGSQALKGIDALVVLDINDVKRLGNLAESVRALTVPRLVIDHHVPSEDPAGSVIVADTTACATGELVFDFAKVAGLTITPEIGRSLYTAIVTDTGGFRFSNTTPRAHAVAAELLSAGVDQAEIYQKVYASAPAGRIRLMAEVLATLGVDEEHGITWLSMDAGALEKFDVKSEDLDGIVENARSIAGTRMALFFRDLGHGKVKVSFRTTGGVDANEFARQFGGGGHVRASGALVTGSMEDVREKVLAAARTFAATGR